MTLFTDAEAAAMESLYPDESLWWEFLWQLSDAVAERCDAAGEFLRWLCRLKQRPFIGASWPTEYRFWAAADYRSCVGHCLFNNYLPPDFLRVSHNAPDVGFMSESSATVLEAAAGVWSALPESRRSQLWHEVSCEEVFG